MAPVVECVRLFSPLRSEVCRTIDSGVLSSRNGPVRPAGGPVIEADGGAPADPRRRGWGPRRRSTSCLQEARLVEAQHFLFAALPFRLSTAPWVDTGDGLLSDGLLMTCIPPGLLSDSSGLAQ